MFEWRGHSDHCAVCMKNNSQYQKGHLGKSKKGRHMKNNVWTREKILQNLEWEELPVIDKVLYLEKDNPHLNLVICWICKNVFYNPIMTITCQHIFCKNCLIPQLEGKGENEGFCPQCDMVITPE